MSCWKPEMSGWILYYLCTGKSLSEALILAATNPHYVKRLFIELRVQCMKTTCCVRNSYGTVVRDFESEAKTKGFSFLNQCFAQLRFWKSVSDSRNLLAGATAVLLETLFQNRSCAKHWYKKLKPLVISLVPYNYIRSNRLLILLFCSRNGLHTNSE